VLADVDELVGVAVAAGVDELDESLLVLVPPLLLLPFDEPFSDLSDLDDDDELDDFELRLSVL
jgi:hypothetical protein